MVYLTGFKGQGKQNIWILERSTGNDDAVAFVSLYTLVVFVLIVNNSMSSKTT
ncbi:MAG: hypothetical protein JJU28_10845 [Cyclobacteriaceae bacterium]|nr:hypothetical protein [Cyclobacteriaceae bacterium]